MQKQCLQWDIFCSVVDNFGDIGICWRLSRQLVKEHQQQVRLWVDNLQSFQSICPQISPLLSVQICRGVEVRLWEKTFCFFENNECNIDVVDGANDGVADVVADIVIQALACTLPEEYVLWMARQVGNQKKPPVWINMEYLSAENWIVGCHGLASPHQQFPLKKMFFFPGFSDGTGGLLREQHLLKQRDNFLSNHLKLNNALRISVFAYPLFSEGGSSSSSFNAFEQLVNVWAISERPIHCLLFSGQFSDQFFADKETPFTKGNVTVEQIPFLEQDEYDRLLWSCDVNFVRGEDSFVRAQWAGKPFVWQIYRQEDNAHWVKLEAFLALYMVGLSESTQKAVEDFWRAWNQEVGMAEAWPQFYAELEVLAVHNEKWIKKLEKLGDFTTNLMLYCQKYL